jgi:hypothetical protein
MPRKPSVATKSDSALSAAATLSFLKETRGLLTWTPKDLQKSLLISAAQAAEAITALEFQGYIKRSGENPKEWITTLNGETVSGSKPPRFDRTKVEDALAALKKRIASANADTSESYRVVRAVAFGDFLSASSQDRSRVQAVDVAIELAPRKKPSASKSEFLRKLRARDIKLNLIPYEPWMSARSHKEIV